MDTVLEARRLSKTYLTASRKHAAVRDVSIRIHESETVGLTGESGCGKSTIARLLTLLLQPDSGSVLYRCKEVTGLHGRQLREFHTAVRMVFQNPSSSFDPRRTLGYSIAESMCLLGLSKKETTLRVQELLEQCGLERSLYSRYPHQASGGQLQRAQIARALAPGPSLLICDEATSALDVTTQKEILELLGWIQKGHRLSILFISHDLGVLQSLCSTIHVMHKGEIVESGRADDIIRSPQSEYTRNLIECCS